MIYGPTVLFALGQGAIIPLIPVMADRFGADLALSGFVASMLVVGQMLGNIPGSWLVAKVGERYAMALAGACALVGAFGLLFAPNVWVLAIAVLINGVCAAVFGLARHAFMTTNVPLGFRARALSVLGGSYRLGIFVGPFAAALLLSLSGSHLSAIWFLIVCLLGAVLLVWLGPDPEQRMREARGEALPSADQGSGQAAVAGAGDGARRSATSTPADAPREGVFRTMVTHRDVLARLGLAAASMSAVRAARQIVLPLWGISLGLDGQSIALIVGISGALDFALFYASGQVMDRYGRLWASVPSMLLMGLGFLVLALTGALDNAVGWFIAMSAVIGLGNGLSSGILMTLGADAAPHDDPAPFLGSWRTLTSAGGAATPLLFSAIVAVAPLAVATAAMGVVGVLGTIGFLRWVPRGPKRVRVG